MELIYEKSQAGPARRARAELRPARCPSCPPSSPARRRRASRSLAEHELVRHFTTLADRNFGIDTGFYPLGTCTMKHNPRVNERVVGCPGSATCTRTRRTRARRARWS